MSCLFLLILVFGSLSAQELPLIEAKTTGFVKQEGFLPVYWDEAEGKIWLEISDFNRTLLYLTSLPVGLGSNDIGLDRGLLGNEYVVRFERVGPQVLLIALNLGFRATSINAAERKAVQEAFAESVLFGFKVEAQTEGRVLVDVTGFVVRDGQGVARQLKNTGQGTFTLDASRSAPYPTMLKAFPKNTELEARLTFTGQEPGAYVFDVAPDPYAVTVRIRHSFIELPDDGYQPRVYDPRSGYYGISYVDYATPIGTTKEKRFIVRHRLQKQNPSAAISEPVEPIVYYLDPGTPEPIRSALLDGARWWAEAFEVAGFRNAYRVEMLPEGADPMDVRYNMIQWVHRATRGWSYGRSVVDPRTGEIIKGHVSLGSLRVRQDYLIAEGLLAPYDADTSELDPENDPMLKTSLARIRQLSAHEVGHTLGIMHNFASSVNNRASVMDYPVALATLEGDTIDLSRAYDVGIGAWDKQVIRYGYTEFTDPNREADGLEAILAETHAQGLLYISDEGARPQGGAHPQAHLWDNNTDAVAALAEEMAVRQYALQRFGVRNIRAGQPMALLEEVLVPLYLRHRYQVEATVKLIGGVDYTYAIKGDGQTPTAPVSGTVQIQALDALLETVTPEALKLPETARTLIPPRPAGYGENRELFDGHTGLTFDPYAPARTVADLVFGLIAHPQRAARLVYQHDADASLPGLEDVFDVITIEVLQAPVPVDAYEAELQRLVQRAWLDALMHLYDTRKMAPAVRALTHQHLLGLRRWLADQPGSDSETVAHRQLMHDDMNRLLNRTFEESEQPAPLTLPPGSPIGQP